MKVKIINPMPRPHFNKMHGHKSHCHCQLLPSMNWEMWCENGIFVDTPGDVFTQLGRINERSMQMLRYSLWKLLR